MVYYWLEYHDLLLLSWLYHCFVIVHLASPLLKNVQPYPISIINLLANLYCERWKYAKESNFQGIKWCTLGEIERAVS
jgi:hypothetical protein